MLSQGPLAGAPVAMQPDPLREDDDSDQVATGGPVGPYAILKARYDRLQQIGLRAQNFCDDLAGQLERVQVGAPIFNIFQDVWPQRIGPERLLLKP